MSIVKGRNMILYWVNPYDDTDVPFACSTSCVFNSPTELKEITSQTSAFFREYEYDIAGWSIQCNGFVTLENYSYLFLLNLRNDRQKITVKFAIDNGVNGFVIVSGLCLLSDLSINAADNEAGTYSCVLQGSGGYSIAGAQPTPSGIVIQGTTSTLVQWQASGGETSHVFTDGIGRTLLYAARGTADFEPIEFVGSPTPPNGCVWDENTGTLSWDSTVPAFAGENFKIIVQ